ncbi:MAG: permease [Christensenellales bacterium]
MFTYILYGAAGGLLALSFFKDKQKTKMALKKAWKALENILPQMFTVLLIIGLTFAVLDVGTISKLLGSQSGILGMAIAAVIGSITLIPGFIAFPLAASLLAAGAGYGQITMFVTTLMMVGVITMPVEKKYFGKKLTLLRNFLGLVYAVIISVIIGGILG